MITFHYAPQHNPDPALYLPLSDVDALEVAKAFYWKSEGVAYAVNEGAMLSFRAAIAQKFIRHTDIVMLVHMPDHTEKCEFNMYGVPMSCHGYMYPNDRFSENLALSAAREHKANKDARVAALLAEKNCKAESNENPNAENS